MAFPYVLYTNYANMSDFRADMQKQKHNCLCYSTSDFQEKLKRMRKTRMKKVSERQNAHPYALPNN